MTKASLPSAMTPALDGRGLLDLSWRRLLEALWKRGGGAADLDITAPVASKVTFAVTNTAFTVTVVDSDGVSKTWTATLS